MIDEDARNDCLSSFRLDQLLADELASSAARHARDHLATCSRCSARFAAFDAERQAFAAAPPAPVPSALTSARVTPRARRPWAWLAVPAALAAGAALWIARPRPTDELEGVRTKGGGHLELFVEHASAMRAGGPGEVVAPGDRLQFAYSSARAGFLTIASVDGAGAVSVYHEESPVAPGEHVTLGESVRLDGTLGDETIYALFCARSIDAAPVVARLRAQPHASPDVDGCEVETLTIVKREAR
jgi:anti-sigma factor RsiW